MTQMLAQREHDYFAETVICTNCYIVAKFFLRQKPFFSVNNRFFSVKRRKKAYSTKNSRGKLKLLPREF